MSRICRNMGDSGKLRFNELGHESKMWLLETHFHTSNDLAMEPGTREEKPLKETQSLQQDQSHPIKSLTRTAGGGGRKGFRTCRITPVWRGGVGKALRQTNRRKGTMARRALVDMEGNTGANTREKSCENLPRAIAWRGVRRRNDKYPGWKVAALTAPRGGEAFSRKNKIEQIQHATKIKDNTQART